jgi:adenine-specific DNA-methyltransferase
MRALLNDGDIRGKVTLVYIDPPFASGARFESRDEEQAYDDVLFGARYLEFIRQRLVLIRELLGDSGSVYVHLDSKMAFPVKVIMDEVFGPANFRNWITRKKCNSKNFTRKQYGSISDYILFYTKTENYVWNKPVEPWTQERAKEYQYIDEASGRLFMKVPVHAPGVRNGETGQPWRGKFPPPGKHWQYPPAVLDKLDANGEIYWSANGNPRRKIFFDQSQGIPVQDLWLELKDAHNQNIDVSGYPTEKNLDLLRRIVNASSNPEDLVLDCFMGSGTTLDAAEEGRRRWIGIDSSSKAIETTLKRLAQGLEPMGDFVNGKNGRGGKNPSTPALFPAAPLCTNFDLYEAPGQQPTVSSAEVKRIFQETLSSTPRLVSRGASSASQQESALD